MRTDKRQPGDLRPVEIVTGYLITAEGSALLKVGNTHVLCAASVDDMTALGERTMIIDCDVLQADGGTRTASITGAYVAMALAFRRLVEYGQLKRMPIKDSVAATSVGIVKGVPMLDLCYEEDSQADVDMNVVMTGSGKFVEVQATAEHEAFDDAQMGQMVALARTGIVRLVEIQKG